VLALGFFAVLIVAALMAPALPLQSPEAMDAGAVTLPPSIAHPLGTDSFGRDVFSRLLFAARVSLLVGTLSAGAAAAAGTAGGLMAGYWGGTLDVVLSRLADTILSFPVILLAIVLAGTLGPGVSNVVIALAVVFSPRFFRLTRGSAISLRSTEFVIAARALGASDRRVMYRHLLPNLLAPLLIQFTVSYAYAIIAEATLSFIGLGIQPPVPSWGSMISEARSYMESAPWFILSAGGLLALTVLELNLMGDALRDLLDPTLGR
jgi:peptide/nickel transport system permease protein